MNTLKMQTSRPLAARRCARPQLARAVPIPSKRNYGAEKVRHSDRVGHASGVSRLHGWAVFGTLTQLYRIIYSFLCL